MGFVTSDGELTPINAGGYTPRITAVTPRGITLYPGVSASYEAIYRTQPNVRTVVSFLGKNAAELNLKLYRRVSDTERTHERDHGLARLLRRPNHRQSRYSFFRQMVEDLGVFDNWLAIKVGGPNGARALVRVPPRSVTVEGANPLFPDEYRITLDGRAPLVLPYTSVVHLYGYNPEEPRWGMSPIETLRRILAEDEAAGSAREQVFQRGLRAAGYIERPLDAPKWKDAARDRFTQGMRAAFAGSGPDAGGVPILEDGMTFKEAKLTPADLDYLGGRKLTRAEVAAAYHLDPRVVGATEGGNINADAAADRRTIVNNLSPLVTFLAEELALQLLPDYEADPSALDELYLEADLEAKLKGDFLAEAEAASRATGAPYLTRNEYRARRNLPPIDGGDDLITPLNVTTGGRASPADTAPGTPGLGQAARPRDLLAALEAGAEVAPAPFD